MKSTDTIVFGFIIANIEFGFKLFSEVAKQNPRQNIFISPASVAMALAMVYNGARDETQQAMMNALEIRGMSLDEVNRANAALRTALTNLDPKVQLVIANSLWARQGIAFEPEFLQRNQDFYQAEVTELDFNDPRAAAIINGWVSKQTKGKINQIIQRINPLATLFLLNAIYFKGYWTVPFDKTKTREDTFTTLDGRQKKHPMMAQSGKFDYCRGQGFQAVSLPYGGGGVSMYVFLPDQNSNLIEFQQRLTAKEWAKMTTQFNRTEGRIVLPRFKIEYETDLNNALNALGMGVAFDQARADFSGICARPPTPNIYLDRVKHKTFVEVNEEGTEAAAVTSIGMAAAGLLLSPPKPFTMIVDRPFFCAIRENKTGTVLFMGSITDPE